MTLPRAPEGKTYEAWVMRKAQRFARRPLLRALLRLPGSTRPVPRGSVVGVTLAPVGGADAPTGTPLVTTDEVS